ncbi:peptidase MA family metallohydrolase [Candidatus Omnitrophota bacterium]
MRIKIVSVLICIFLLSLPEPGIILTLPGINVSFRGAENSWAKGEWKELRSEHFFIYYKNSSRDFLDKLRRQAEDYYRNITEELGFRRKKFWTWENRAKIYVFDSHESYIEETNMASWSSASVDYRNKIISTYPDAPELFQNVLVHELTHIIFREYVGFSSNIPLWLDEGVASFMEQKKDASRIIRGLTALAKNDSLLNLQKLTAISNVLSFPQEKANIFYAQSFGLIYFLVDKFNRDDFAELCFSLRRGRTLEKSLYFTYGINGLDELEAQWRKYLLD